MGAKQDVHHRPDEDEGRGEDVDPDAGNEGGGVVAQQFHPEPADTVGRHVQREQPTMPHPELAIDQDQNEEDSDVPQQLVEKGRMDHGGDLTGGHLGSRECTSSTPEESRW